jgi:hypothetical protein
VMGPPVCFWKAIPQKILSIQFVKPFEPLRKSHCFVVSSGSTQARLSIPYAPMNSSRIGAASTAIMMRSIGTRAPEALSCACLER